MSQAAMLASTLHPSQGSGAHLQADGRLRSAQWSQELPHRATCPLGSRGAFVGVCRGLRSACLPAACRQEMNSDHVTSLRWHSDAEHLAHSVPASGQCSKRMQWCNLSDGTGRGALACTQFTHQGSRTLKVYIMQSAHQLAPPRQSSVGRVFAAQRCRAWGSASERTSVRHPAQLVGLAGALAGCSGRCIALRRAQHGRLGHAEARPVAITGGVWV